MNRHARRAQQASIGKQSLPAELSQALATLGSLQDFAAVADRIKPYLDNIEAMTARLDAASGALTKAQNENVSLRLTLERQREVFLRMFAQGMGISLEEVLSMEGSIQGQLPSQNEPKSHADTTPESVEFRPKT